MTSGTTAPAARIARVCAAFAAIACLAAPPATAAEHTNGESITIFDGEQASPFPSSLGVVGVDGVVTDVDVVLRGVTHDRPDDLDVLLVAPSGDAVALMSDACGFTPLLDADLRFDQSGAALPSMEACVSGTSYRPEDHEGVGADGWPAGKAPNADLDDLIGDDADGTWELYVADGDGSTVNGSIDSWAIDLETREGLPVGLSIGSATVAEGGTLAFDVVRTAAEPSFAGSITVATSSGTATSGSDFVPLSQTLFFAPGETRKTVEVQVLADGPLEPQQDFSVLLGNPDGDASVGTPAAVGITIPADAQQPADDIPPNGDPPNPAFTVANSLRAPRARRCRRAGERLTIRPRTPAGVAIVRSRVYVNRGLVEDNVEASAAAPIHVTMAGRRMRVRVVLTSHDGRTITLRRTFRRCKRR